MNDNIIEFNCFRLNGVYKTTSKKNAIEYFNCKACSEFTNTINKCSGPIGIVE